MAVKVGVAYVDVRPDLSGFGRQVSAGVDQEMGRAGQQANRSMSEGFRRGAAALTGVFAGGLAVRGIREAVGAASELGEAVNVTGLIFKDARGEIDEFVRSSAAIGLSETQARQLTASLGGLLQNMGLSSAETVEWSKRLTTLGADMGSAFDTAPADAIQAIGSALRGEQEPIRRFNVVLDDATVRQKAVEMGLAATTAEVDRQAKTMAILQLITEQTAAIQGDFANTADSLANRQRKLAAETVNLKAALGEALIPVMETATGTLSTLTGAFTSLPRPVQKASVSFAGLAAAGIGIGLIVPKIKQAHTALQGMGTAGALASRSLGLFAKGGVLVGGAFALAQGLQFVHEKVVDLTGGGTGSIPKLTESIADFLSTGEVVGDLQKQFGENLAGIGDVLKSFNQAQGGFGTAQRFLDPGFKAADRDIDSLDKTLASLVSSGHAERAAEFFAEISRQGEAAGVSVDKTRKYFNDYTDAVSSVAAESKLGAKEISGIGDASDDSRPSVGGLTEELKSLLGVTRDTVDAQRSVEQAGRALESARRDEADAQADLNALLRQGAVDLEAIADAEEAVLDARRSASKAARDQAKAQAEYDAALAAFNLRGWDTDRERLAETTEGLADANDGLADAQDREKDAAADLRRAQAGDPEFQDRIAEARRRVRDATQNVADAQYNLSQRSYEAVDAHNAETTAMEGNTVAAYGLRRELEELLKLNPELRAFLTPVLESLPATPIPLDAIARFGENPLGFFFGKRAPVARQHGGPVWPGQDFIVGEDGPERVRFGAAGTVIPSTASTTNNVSMTINEKVDPAHLARELVWRLA